LCESLMCESWIENRVKWHTLDIQATDGRPYMRLIRFHIVLVIPSWWKGRMKFKGVGVEGVSYGSDV
jgi:hypothetical protein